MFGWHKRAPQPAGSREEQIRRQYASFRRLLELNNEALELLAGIQEDLHFVAPLREVLEDRVETVYHKVNGTVAALEQLSGVQYDRLHHEAATQQTEIGTFIARSCELEHPELSAWLADVGAGDSNEVGGKAAALGEIKNTLRLAVPEGYVLTAEAYRQFCGAPMWQVIRDATKNVDLNDFEGLGRISAALTESVLNLPMPRAIEVAIEGRARILEAACEAYAVRSSAVGEGGARTFAGQFTSLINIPRGQTVDAYRRVVAGRFSERALFYRLSSGLPEIAAPMAVLVLGLVPARAAGIMYTRDPASPRGEHLWITATHGFGLDIASGHTAADLFILDRKRTHTIIDRTIVPKPEQIVANPEGGLMHQAVPQDRTGTACVSGDALRQLAEWGIRIEQHFGVPQDIEWAMDSGGQIWLLQARNLVLSDAAAPSKLRIKQEPIVSGGRMIFPGRVSGAAFLAHDPAELAKTPEGAVVFLRRPTPEMVRVFPRIAGLVTEWGNVAGHGSALLREFKVPSVFQMPNVFALIHSGDAVSLDAVQPRIFAGLLWPTMDASARIREMQANGRSDPISQRLLKLHLLDPAASNFRPSGCKSAHDIFRFCHEKAIEIMFEVNDLEVGRVAGSAKKLLASVPINLHVLDLGGGLAVDDPNASQVRPEQITSRPFQALWRGISHPNVSWRRQMAASLSDLASVMASSLRPETGAMRALGESSYLLVADEYMNLNSRLAYHFSLVDACVSDVPGNNYISFRFAGGGAASNRRDLRARFLEGVLTHYGFRVDRRGDLVNAWFKKSPAEHTSENLDILGRLLACSSQLDMYMTNREVMRWYVQQFLKGNYAFEEDVQSPEVVRVKG